MFGKLALAGLAAYEYQHHKQNKSQKAAMAELQAENMRLRNQQGNPYVEAEYEQYGSRNEKPSPAYQPQQMRIQNSAGSGKSMAATRDDHEQSAKDGFH